MKKVNLLATLVVAGLSLAGCSVAVGDKCSGNSADLKNKGLYCNAFGEIEALPKYKQKCANIPFDWVDEGQTLTCYNRIVHTKKDADDMEKKAIEAETKIFVEEEMKKYEEELSKALPILLDNYLADNKCVNGMIEKTAAIRMFAAVHKFNYNNDDYGLDYKLEMYLDLIRKNFGDEWADTIYNDIVLKKSLYMAYDTVDICKYENKAITKGRMLFCLNNTAKKLTKSGEAKITKHCVPTKIVLKSTITKDTK